MPLITIATYTLPHEMAIDRSKLEANNIPCFVKDEMTAQVHNFLSNAIGGVKLQVLEKDLEEAKAILADSEQLLADYSDSPIKCTHCQSGNVSGKGLNGKISLFILMLTGLPIPIFSSKLKCFDCGRLFKFHKN
ncbi:MAG: DUF2007 domain-containing protein [Vicingaceae bacterium]